MDQLQPHTVAVFVKHKTSTLWHSYEKEELEKTAADFLLKHVHDF